MQPTNDQSHQSQFGQAPQQAECINIPAQVGKDLPPVALKVRFLSIYFTHLDHYKHLLHSKNETVILN